MQPIIATTISELKAAAQQLFEGTSSRWWFRGQKSAEWHLLPSVKRGYSRKQERYLTNLFYTAAKSRYSTCPPRDDFGAWLALMQHYGLPTRLLDWTHSLLTAAYFATKYSFDMGDTDDLGDAAIWSLEPIGLNVAQGYGEVFPPLDAHTVEPLVRPAMKGDDTSQLAVLAVAPIEADTKMLTQQAAFTVHVSNVPLDLMEGSEGWLRKLVIPRKSVPEIACELDVLGLRLANLFPDLYHLAIELKRAHTPS